MDKVLPKMVMDHIESSGSKPDDVVAKCHDKIKAISQPMIVGNAQLPPPPWKMRGIE